MCALERLLSESRRVDGLDVLFACWSVVLIADFTQGSMQGTHFFKNNIIAQTVSLAGLETMSRVHR